MNRGDPVRSPAGDTVSEPTTGRSAPNLSQRAALDLLREGECRDARALLSQHPEWASNKSFVLDLAYEEYNQRREAGEQIDCDSFCGRFPRFQSSLRRLLGVHHFLEANPDLLHGPAPWPEAGQEFHGYRLIGELGRGAFARVFLATEPALGGRQVALKVSRFGTSEAQTLGRLQHPNIIPIHSTQVDPNTGFAVICMPYLGSATLCDVLDRVGAGNSVPKSSQVVCDAIAESGRLGDSSVANDTGGMRPHGSFIDAVLRIGGQLADALAFVHALGICHRDLKPSNVLLAADGRPMLLDFNLSFDEQLADNRVGGTLPYMAPEQLLATDSRSRSDAALVDARSDLFSLGVVLYELLSGKHPFGSLSTLTTAPAVRTHLLEQQRLGARPLREANPRVDRGLARLVHRCLAYDPAERPQTAAEVRIGLRRSLSWRRRTERWIVGHRFMATTFGIAAVLAVALGTYSWSVGERYGVREWHAGQTTYRRKNYREAVQHFDRALEAEGKSAVLLFARGRAYQQLGEWRLALIDYQAADELQADGPTRACAGYCLARQGFTAEATLYLVRAMEAGYSSPEVFNDLGYCYHQRGKLKEAREALDRAIQLAPALQAPFYNRSLVRLQEFWLQPKTDPREGLADIRRALEIGPQAADLLRHATVFSAEAGVFN